MTATPDRCENARKAALRRARPRTKAQRDAWEKRLRLKYGITAEDVALKWAEQEGRCPICRAELATKTWVIDHNHRLPKGPAAFRGVLDAWCNQQIVSRAERGGMLRGLNTLVYLGWARAEQRTGERRPTHSLVLV